MPVAILAEGYFLGRKSQKTYHTTSFPIKKRVRSFESNHIIIGQHIILQEVLVFIRRVFSWGGIPRAFCFRSKSAVKS